MKDYESWVALIDQDLHYTNEMYYCLININVFELVVKELINCV